MGSRIRWLKSPAQIWCDKPLLQSVPLGQAFPFWPCPGGPTLCNHFFNLLSEPRSSCWAGKQQSPRWRCQPLCQRQPHQHCQEPLQPSLPACSKISSEKLGSVFLTRWHSKYFPTWLKNIICKRVGPRGSQHNLRAGGKQSIFRIFCKIEQGPNQ